MFWSVIWSLLSGKRTWHILSQTHYRKLFLTTRTDACETCRRVTKYPERCFLCLLYWLYCSLCIHKLVAWWTKCIKIRVPMWKNNVTVQAQIILYYFNTIHSGYFLVHPCIYIYKKSIGTTVGVSTKIYNYKNGYDRWIETYYHNTQPMPYATCQLYLWENCLIYCKLQLQHFTRQEETRQQTVHATMPQKLVHVLVICTALKAKVMSETNITHQTSMSNHRDSWSSKHVTPVHR
jgi:hypothetical protein